MSEDDTGHSRKSSQSGAIAGALLALPLLYALSIGPVALFFSKYHGLDSMEDAATVFYSPIFWLHEHTSMKQPIDAYLEWWEGLGETR